MRSLLLAKSNLRKNKGLSICIALLILIGSMFLCISCLLVFDFQKNSYNEAERLNTSDISLYSTSNAGNITKEYIDSIIPDSASEYLYTEDLSIQTSIKFNNGEVSSFVSFIKSDALNRNLSKIEILEEDKNIIDNYIYIPYHIHTGGGINIGDTYEISFPTNTYSFKVKGYINTIYGGSYSLNQYHMLISDEDYAKIEKDNPNSKSFTIYINYKDNLNDTSAVKESNKIVRKILIDKNVEANVSSLNTTIESRTFLSMIFFASFLLTAIIIIGIVMLMIFNNISNYIKENIKNLGALKAIGYTTKDLNTSLLLQFSILTIIGLILGIIFAYLFMPIITNMLIGQSGIPYNLKFNIISTLITIIAITIFVLFVVIISIRKIKKIEPIIALRDGVENHNFKKNHISLDKSKLSINASLSLKNIFKNTKQNIISFMTIIFLSFLMIAAMTMYQNFSREPNLSLLTFEISDGIIGVDNEIKEEFVKDLKNDKDIKDFKYLTNYVIQDKDFLPFVVYILEDANKINNKDNCYKGRYPKHDNEIAISGKYAKENGYNIGDEIEYQFGDKNLSYLIIGFIQSTNNSGREAVLLYDGAKKLFNIDEVSPTYYFDSNVKASEIIDKYSAKYDDKIIYKIDFEELLKSQMYTFISVANLMVIIISIISGCIIVLVLYLLMKSMIYNRRYEYGILKALGYKTKDLIIQNVLAFMPNIIFATIIGISISYYTVNPYIGFMMRSFGIMKCTMVIPMDLLTISALFIIGISVISTILMSLKIRKIEPYSLLIGE